MYSMPTTQLLRACIWSLLAWACLHELPAQSPSFSDRISGEVLTYFSPYREFADQSLLTRANGHSPIEFTAEMSTPGMPAEYRFLIGHSTGTSSGERDFDVEMNGQWLFTFHTEPKMPLGAVIQGQSAAAFRFESIEQDINGDAFGFLVITLDAAPAGKPVFRITGRNHESRDWLMVFMYKPGWKLNVFPTSLVLREGRKRQVNFSIDSPWPDGTWMEIRSGVGTFTYPIYQGYQTFAVPMYPEDFQGVDTIACFIDGRLADTKALTIEAVRPFTFHIIHHSHNDIGYSHLQTEVERIQTENIRSALRWIHAARQRGHDAYWHVESLWAVENFLRNATPKEEATFAKVVKDGYLVLSANYANVLTGLAQPEELDWMTEYARKLEDKYGFRVRNAMITDIPGVSYWGLESYTRNHIPFLALGPNYVEAYVDRGDRVGGVIRETGDKMFYWKPNVKSADSLLVWTAGKGYSYFHNIQDSEKRFKWEQKLSRYVQELTDNGYPYDIVQLRYTKNADNGPVDTLFDVFVAEWNQRFASPILEISSVDKLFASFIGRYGDEIPVRTGGEISPYWEDGAYSTAQEENDSRMLARRTIRMEEWARAQALHDRVDWYPLHRFLVLWHEHTWGAWCSVSDPEIFFTTEQWRIKKSFLDSALVQYAMIAKAIEYTEPDPEWTEAANRIPILDFAVDPRTGGLASVRFEGFDLPVVPGDHSPFQLVYVEGTDQPTTTVPIVREIETLRDDASWKEISVHASMPFFPVITTTYALNKQSRSLEVRYTTTKLMNTSKESLHACLPIRHAHLEYGEDDQYLHYPEDQLPGSNYEFICTPHSLKLADGSQLYRLETPEVALVEIGGIIDEHRERGAKVWRREPQPTSPLYLYILNNYWHTNYKADQEGEIRFNVRLVAEKAKS
jgi:hypothetical protein